MSTLVSVSPQFLVADLSVALSFYVDCLGFTRQIDYGGFYASVVRDGCAIHLKCARQHPGERQHRQENDHVDAFIETVDAERLLAEFESRGVTPFHALARQPWGATDFYLVDPDGHVLCFSQPVD